MYFEVVAFWGLICLIMFFLAEYKPRLKVVAIIGGILLVFLGVWLMAEPMQIKTGESTIKNQTITSNVNGTVIYPPATVQQENEYAIASGGYFNLNQTLGIIFMLIGIWAAMKNALEIKNDG